MLRRLLQPNNSATSIIKPATTKLGCRSMSYDYQRWEPSKTFDSSNKDRLDLNPLNSNSLFSPLNPMNPFDGSRSSSTSSNPDSGSSSKLGKVLKVLGAAYLIG